MNPNGIITLTTDFGTGDQYVGLMKGVILGRAPAARIVDLCHMVPAQDIVHAAYQIASSYHYFPAGTLHLVVVDPDVGSSRDIILVEAHGHFFLAPDNGVLTLVLREAEAGAVRVIKVQRPDLYLEPVSQTFHGRDILAPLAAFLVNGHPPADLGPALAAAELATIEEPPLKIDHEAGKIHGSVIHIDHYGNITTNIPRHALEQLTNAGEGVSILAGEHIISGLRQSYNEVERGRSLLIFNSSDFLEISINCGDAARNFNVRLHDQVTLNAP